MAGGGATAASVCTPCTAGRYSGGVGKAAADASSGCAACDAGAIAPGAGAGACTPCPLGAQSVPSAGGTSCVACPLRLNCAAGNQCIVGSGTNDTFCGTCLQAVPLPGGTTANFYDDNGQCAQCPSLPILPIIVGLFLVILLMVLVQNGMLSPASLRVVRQFSVHIQLINVYFSFHVRWPAWLTSWLKVLSYLSFDISLYSPECAIGGGYERGACTRNCTVRLALKSRDAAFFLILFASFRT